MLGHFLHLYSIIQLYFIFSTPKFQYFQKIWIWKVLLKNDGNNERFSGENNLKNIMKLEAD